MKEVDYGSHVVVIFINNNILLSAEIAFKTLCTEYMIELSNIIRKRFFSSNSCQLKLHPKIAVSPGHSFLTIIPLRVQFPNLAEDIGGENFAKEWKRLPFCTDLKKYAGTDIVYF